MAVSSLSVKYQGKEIYDKVSVARCWHDMHAWGALDELAITFGDTQNLWDGWDPKDDDIIEVSDGAARTGKMYVRDVQPRSSAMDIRAYPVPHTMRRRSAARGSRSGCTSSSRRWRRRPG